MVNKKIVLFSFFVLSSILIQCSHQDKTSNRSTEKSPTRRALIATPSFSEFNKLAVKLDLVPLFFGEFGLHNLVNKRISPQGLFDGVEAAYNDCLNAGVHERIRRLHSKEKLLEQLFLGYEYKLKELRANLEAQEAKMSRAGGAQSTS